jgi:hypothetical protein
VPVAASLGVALDVSAEEVEALVDVGDQGLVRRQAAGGAGCSSTRRAIRAR